MATLLYFYSHQMAGSLGSEARVSTLHGRGCTHCCAVRTTPAYLTTLYSSRCTPPIICHQQERLRSSEVPVMLIEDQQRLDNMGQQISELVARAAVSCSTELFSSAAALA